MSLATSSEPSPWAVAPVSSLPCKGLHGSKDCHQRCAWAADNAMDGLERSDRGMNCKSWLRALYILSDEVLLSCVAQVPAQSAPLRAILSSGSHQLEHCINHWMFKWATMPMQAMQALQQRMQDCRAGVPDAATQQWFLRDRYEWVVLSYSAAAYPDPQQKQDLLGHSCCNSVHTVL